MGQDGQAKPTRAKAKRRRARTKREEEVRKKYDFSVIRTLRQKRGLTIEKFARLCGLSYAPISRIETNLIKPNLETLDKISSGLGISTYMLVAMAEKRESELRQGQMHRSGGFSFTVFNHDGFVLAHGAAPAGAVADDLGLRAHEYESVAVTSGLLGVTVNEKQFKIEAGQSIQYDRVFPHEIRAIEDVELVVVGHSRA